MMEIFHSSFPGRLPTSTSHRKFFTAMWMKMDCLTASMIFMVRLQTNNANGSKFNVFGFSFNDKATYQGVSEYKWNSNGFGSSFVIVPAGSSVLMDGNFAYSQYKINLKEADNRPRSSLINGFNLSLNFTYFTNKDEIKYGLEALGFKTDFEYYNFLGSKIEQEENTTELAAYVNYRKVWKKVVLEPGFRFHYYASLSEMSFEPGWVPSIMLPINYA